MKKIITILLLAATSATAQIQLLDGTTPHTNSTTTSANLNVPSKGWTNVPYATTNYIYITFGDGLPASATTKLNSDLVYLTNQLALALQLPNQINTNWQAAVGIQSNRINIVIINLATVSNNLATTMATVASFPGGQIQNGTVNSNKFTSATLSWLQSMPTPGVNLLDKYYSLGSANYVPVADGSGQWAWGAVPMPATMSFDSGNITSDGSGNASFVSIFAQQLKDSGYSTGGSGQVAIANGSGGWYWTAWPATLNYDGGLITSDGSGNLVGTTWRGGLIDNGYSSGTTGYVPTANGDGTWTWAFGGGAGGASLTDVTNIATGITVVSSNGVVGWVNSQNFVTALTTNIARTSHRYTIFATNNFTMSGSNYVGRFSQVYDWQLTEPQIGGGGLSPSTSLPEALWGSFSGTNNWFPLTNGAVFFTNISISVVGTNITGLGGVTIYGLDHPELYGNVVAFDGQTFNFNGSKIATLNDLAATVHVLAPPVQMAGGWILDSQIVSGNELVTFYSHNSKVFEMAAGGSSINQAFGGLDGTGTNITIMTPATNLLTGWTLEQCTNLSAPVLWLPTSNFTTNISGGVVTFTVPMNFGLQAQFFRLRLPSATTATFSVPATFSVGTLYPSNTWSLYAITNVMHAGDIMTVNSNGVKLVDVWMSNSTPILKPHW